MKSVTRLYTQFQPKKYDLSLKLNPDDRTFSGKVVITGMRTGRPSQRLTFHQKDLKITEATVRRIDKRHEAELSVTRIYCHKSYDEVRIHTQEKIMPGEYEVELHFHGTITDPMNGLYPCYFTHEGKEKILLATQFESHHAREVFPCIDEPEAKAVFDLTLDTPLVGSVLANTPAVSEKTAKDRRITTFETTPVMSTYLLAFAYGEVGYLESKTKRGTVIRTYAVPDKVNQTEFALDVAVRCLEYYEDYFDIPYPLPKQDMIALPDFASGAMENWGLITYREQTLLVDPKNTSIGTKQYVAMVVAHELAHQWFGNLVTMRWWTDLWLNEGFASWIEYLACDHLFPEWHMWTQFTANEQQHAFRLDALDNTHPIEVPIKHPDEIRSIFDTISYSKGASVIHMLNGYLGEEDFRNGLRYYLKKHSYGNTDTIDLWAALEHVSKKPVKEFMHVWTSQPGFPLVHVRSNKGTTEVSQERFYMHKPAETEHTIWPIPLLSSTEDVSTLRATTHTYKTAPIGKINRGQSGFYRVVYDQLNLAAAIKELPSLEPVDRLGILSDAFETAKAGYSSVVDALKLLEHYQDEDNAAVWDVIASNLVELRRTMDDDSLREAIKPFVRKLVAKQLARLGWEEKNEESYFDKLLRPTILGLASGADEKSVVQEAIKRFESAKELADIHPDIRSVVLNTAARHGDVKTYDKLLGFHNSSDSSEDRTTLSAALTSFEQPELSDRSLALITTKDVRRQDAMYWIAYSFMNRFAKQATWQWMKDNWGWLNKELGSDLSFYRTPVYAARSFSTKEFLGEYNTFFKEKSTPALERSIKQGQEMLEFQIAWKNRDLKPLLDYLHSL